ncbi:MAG: alpha-amylase, partial [Nitrospirae bacterium]
IRIILDGVFNHTGRGFYQFNHILECGPSSPFIDWFHIRGFPLNAYDTRKKPNYRTWAGYRELPKLNTDNPDVREFIFGVVKYWSSLGIDGWRLDVPAEIDDDDFWREFRRIVKSINSEAYIVGEIWVDEIHRTAHRWLSGDQFDAIMNYGLTSACIAFFIGNKLLRHLIEGQGHAPKRPLNAEEFSERIEHLLNLYPTDIVYCQYNLLDSHDIARFLTLSNGDKRILKMAYTFLMTYIGAPSIYYGTEIGLEGGRDPDCRRAMPWDELSWDRELLDYFKKLISIRRTYNTLRKGSYKTLQASKSGIYSFLRTSGDEKIVIILNNSSNAYDVDTPIGDHISDGTILRCLLNGDEFYVKHGRVRGARKIEPKSAAILCVVK